jgi:MFS family permease
MSTSSTLNAIEPRSISGAERPAAERLWTGQFVLILAALLGIGFSFSVFLLLPKFVAVELGAGARTIGQLSAAAMIPGVLCVPLVGVVIDRYPRRLLMTVGAALMGAAAFGFVWVDRVGALAISLRILQGTAFLVVFNTAATAVATLAPPQRLGQAIGLFGVAVLSTNALAPMVAEPLAERVGWPAVFTLGGVAASIAAALALRMRDDARPRTGGRAGYRELLTTRHGVLLAVSATGGCALGTMFTFTQPFALELGVDRISGFFTAYTLAAVVMRLGLGSIADRIGRRRVGVAALGLDGAVVMATAGLQPALLQPLGVGFGIAHGLFYPAFTAFAIEQSPESRRGSLLTLLNGAFNAGMAVSVALSGWAAEAVGYPPIFLLAGSVTLGGAILLARARNSPD